MARPRGEIPDPEKHELTAAAAAYRVARDKHQAADARLRAAADAAFQAGGSHTAIAEAAGIAKSTVQKYVTPRKDAGS